MDMNFEIFNIDTKVNTSLTEANRRSEKVKQVLVSEYRYIL